MLIKGVLISSYSNAKKFALLLVCLFFISYTNSFAVLNPGSVGDNQSICSGSSPATFTSISPASNGSNPLNYQWQISTTSSSTGFADIVGATSLTYTSGALTQTTYFRRAVSTITDAVVFTGAITVTVSDSSVGGTIYRSRNSCRGTDLTIFTLVGNVGNVIRWESSPSNLNPVWTTIANTTNELTLSVFSTTTYYRAVVQNGSCPIAFSSINFTNANPTVANGNVYTPPPGIACGGTNSFVFTLVAFTGTVLRWESSPSPGFSSPTVIPNTANLTQITVTNLTSTTYYRAITSTGNCSAISSTNDGKEILPPSIGGTIAGTDTVCSTTNSTLLTLSGHSGTILRWESSPNINFSSINTITNSTTTYTATNVLSTTYYRALVKNGTCPEAYSSTAVISVNTSTPVGGTISGGGTYCTSASSIPLTLSGHTGNIVSWQSADDSTFTTNVTTISTTNNPLSVGRPFPFVRYYRALVTIPGCGSTFSSFVKIIVVNQTVAGTSTGNITFCSTTNSHTITLSGNVGSVLRWESSPNSNFIPLTNINTTTTTLALTNINTTTYYRAVVRNDSCDIKTSTSAIVTILTSPDAGTLTGSDTICNLTNLNSTTLVLSSFVGSISKWQSSTSPTFTSGVVDIVNTTNTYTATNLTTTTYYRVIVTSGTCPADTSNIAVIMLNPPSNGGNVTGNNPFNPNVIVCSGINSSTLILSGHVGTILKWQSSLNADFTSPVTDIANTTNTYVATNLTSTTYYRAIVKSGICEADTSSIRVITVNPVSDGGLLGSDTVCIGTNSTTLRLTNYVGSIVKWESSTVSNFSSGVTTIANATDSLVVTNLSTTTYYRVIVKSGVCSADTSSIASILITAPTVGGTITGPLGFCSLINSSTLTLSNHIGTIIEWQSSTTSNFSGTVTSIPNTANLSSITITNLSVTTYYRVLLQNGSCASTFSSIKALSSLGPFPVAGSITGPSSVCIGANNATLTLTGFVGTILKWQSSTSANFSSNVIDIANTTSTLTIVNLSSPMYYKAIVFNGSNACEDTTATKGIIIDTKPIAGTIIGSDTICATSITNSTLFTLTGFTGTILKWQSSTSPIFATAVTDISNTTNTYTALNLSVTTYFRAIVSNGVCNPDTSTIGVLLINNASVGGTLRNDTVCAGVNSTLLRLTNYVGTILKWESASTANFTGVVTNINNTTDSLLVLNLSTTTYFRAIVKSGVCAADTSNVIFIRVDVNSVAGTLLRNDTVCAGTNSTLLRLTNYVGTILKWESASTANFTGVVTNINNTTDSLLVLNLSTTTYYRAIVKSGVCAADTSNVVFIRVDVNTVAGTLLRNDTVCAGTNSTLMRLTNYVGTILKWESATTANFTGVVTNINNTTDSLLVLNLTSTTYFRAIVKSGVCAAETSNVVSIVVFSNSISNIIVSPIPDSFFVSGNPDTILGSLANADTSIVIYVWQSSTTSDTTGFTTIVGASNIHFNPDTILQTTWYRRIVYHTYCGLVDTSNTIKLVVYRNGTIVNASIGTSLSVTKPVAISPGVYQIDYTITIKNYGNLDLENIRIIENLDTVFPSPSTFSILSISNSNGLVVNANFDGVNNVELLDPTQSSLLVSELKTIRLTLQINTNLPSAIYINQVYAFANAVNTSISVTDTSVDGNNPDPNNDGIPDEQSPTIIEIAVFVPSGFSPNGDNKNDEFIIVGLENYPNNKLEIYNRWGNLVFEQAPYDNKWKGSVRNTDAIVFGDGLLPSGTYFYLLDFGVPGVKQLTGYIVIRK